ncbi:MAG: cation diffusion facilitator family transporter, partial [Promethearchaeota archaeon]
MQIDESKSSDSSRERARLLKQGERLTAYSAFAAVALLTLKLLAGLLSGSISLIGDAFDAFSDIFTMSASWFGLRVSQRSPDRRFPYGYYRVENLIGLIVSVFIVFIGAVLLRESIIQILAPTQLRFASMAFAAAIVSIIASFWIFHYLSKVGTRIGSEIILINARERKSDILKSSTVFVSLVFSYIGFLHAGGVVGIILSILILRIGVISTKDTTLLLLDAWTDPELLGSIETIVSKVDGVKEMRDIKLRKSGSFIFGEATVGVSGFLDVKRAHEITDRIEKKLKEEVSHLDMFTVHIEPAKVEKIR